MTRIAFAQFYNFMGRSISRRRHLGETKERWRRRQRRRRRRHAEATHFTSSSPKADSESGSSCGPAVQTPKRVVSFLQHSSLPRVAKSSSHLEQNSASSVTLSPFFKKKIRCSRSWTRACKESLGMSRTLWLISTTLGWLWPPPLQPQTKKSGATATSVQSGIQWNFVSSCDCDYAAFQSSEALCLAIVYHQKTSQFSNEAISDGCDFNVKVPNFIMKNALFFVHFVLLAGYSASSDNDEGIFTSNADLQLLLSTEAELVRGLRAYVEAEEAKLDRIRKWVTNMKTFCRWFYYLLL